MNALARLHRLRTLMADHQLSNADVARILERAPPHVRSWMAGINPIPPQMLRLLELELKERGNLAVGAQSTIAVQG